MAIHSVEFPETPLTEVVSTLVGSKRTSLPSVEHAAAALVQKKAMKHLQPLVPISLKRYTYIVRRLADIAMAEIANENCSGIGMVGHYDGFKKELRRIFDAFVQDICTTCEERLQHIVQQQIQYIDGSLTSGMENAVNMSQLNPSFDETRKRVMTSIFPELAAASAPLTINQMCTEEGANTIRLNAAKLWAGIRFMMAKNANCALNHDFFQPIFDRLRTCIQQHFASLPESKFDEMFQTGVNQLKQRVGLLQAQIERLTSSRDRFREVVRKIQERTGSQRP